MELDPQVMADLFASSKWAPLGALIIFAIVRLLKDDTKLPTIPVKYRPVLLIALGIAAGFLEKLGTGGTWQSAAFFGLASALGAVMGHKVGVDVLRDGKDVPVPARIKVEAPEVPKESP